VIPRVIGGFVPIDRVFSSVKGFDVMAVKKSSGSTKKDGSASKKAGVKKSAAKKETPKKSSKGAAKKAAPKKKASPKKAKAKAAKGPVKLTASQSDLLQKIGSSGETGYRSAKKAEQRTIDALQERKLIKRGAKDKASGSYSYLISNTGKKHLVSAPPASGGESIAPASPTT
jgi:hypothetical protein